MFKLQIYSIIVSNSSCPDNLLLLVLVHPPGPGVPPPLVALVAGVAGLLDWLPGGEHLHGPGRDPDMLRALAPAVVHDVDLNSESSGEQSLQRCTLLWCSVLMS